MSNTPQTLKDGAIALVIALFLLALGALGAYFTLKRHFQAQIEALKPEVVQVITRDTIRLSMPIEIEKRILVRDTIAIAVTDTLLKIDTLYLPPAEGDNDIS